MSSGAEASILVAGEGAVVERIERALSATGRPFVRGKLSADDDEPSLFEQAFTHRVGCVVAVEDLHGTACSPEEPLLAEAIRAGRAPGVSRLVVVTSRRHDDPLLTAVRRSGTPYVIVQAPGKAVDDAVLDLEGRRILVPADAAVRLRATPVGTLVDQTMRALTDDELQGRTLVLPIADADEWTRLLAARGAHPRTVAPWRARVGRWLGQMDLASLSTHAPASLGGAPS